LKYLPSSPSIPAKWFWSLDGQRPYDWKNGTSAALLPCSAGGHLSARQWSFPRFWGAAGNVGKRGETWGLRLGGRENPEPEQPEALDIDVFVKSLMLHDTGLRAQGSLAAQGLILRPIATCTWGDIQAPNAPGHKMVQPWKAACHLFTVEYQLQPNLEKCKCRASFLSVSHTTPNFWYLHRKHLTAVSELRRSTIMNHCQPTPPTCAYCYMATSMTAWTARE
jgi:hypothetical protein